MMLADDHALMRAGIANALRDLPELELVAEASDGPSVFAALPHAQPDLLLIDVTMPDFEPIAAIRHIRARYPGMKILVISAYDDDVYVQGLLAAGVNGYHLKDQPLSDLQLAVRRVLNGERWISSRLLDKLVGHSGVPHANTEGLTTRQRDILQFLQQGRDNQAIAQRLGLSVKTVEKCLTSLYRQLSVQSRLEAVSYATQHPEILAFSGRTADVHACAASPTTSAPIGILLVDDNLRYRHQLCRQIGKTFLQALIYEAENATEAVALLQKFSLQLALVDVVLGDESGISCTRRLKAIRPQMRIVLITAYPDRQFHVQGIAAGAIALVDKKDLDAATLCQLVEDAIRSA